MSLARGERVYFDFDNGNIEPVAPDSNDAPAPAPALASAFVGDILERPAGGVAQPPVAPSLKGTAGGFPAHKKRTPKVSAFKRERAANGDMKVKAKAKATTQSNEDVGKRQVQNKGASGGESSEERRQIDEENRQKLASMSQEEIAEEQRELLESLPPSLIQRLLTRANIDDGSNEVDWDAPQSEEPPAEEIIKNESEPKETSTKKVAFAEPDTHKLPPTAKPVQPLHQEPPTSTEPSTQPDLSAELPDHGSIHFPRPAQPPDLDPNNPAFLEHLHEKYFPNLAYDPSTLSWMTPIDPNDTASPYHPSHQAFSPKDLRFDFKGALLAPSAAREIPVDQGLHHHADAPEAAGYTVTELAVMARSSVAAQRCIAFQTLGRFLYRLGRGEFGFEKVRRRTGGPVQVAVNPDKEDEVDEEDIETDMDDAGSAMAAGLWKEVEEGKVIETLTEEANRESGHLSSRTFAQEALWNWRRGGGRKRAAV
ncbi:hypothetical protein BU23DRAFT_533013 [Bimuria novae-zelandiae CBS 107.79]|uniref:Transcription factor Rba50 n=1 Tax=Bimuria novae-zelandiae CBS 107.79 TaxID=1447943 RepID=A0A6A5V8L1_9PLEO|nr:hypothetical protein BU23DRAFT_533013 [Bimuria novae-zelandiae CBS 107.79]